MLSGTRIDIDSLQKLFLLLNLSSDDKSARLFEQIIQ